MNRPIHKKSKNFGDILGGEGEGFGN